MTAPIPVSPKDFDITKKKKPESPSAILASLLLVGTESLATRNGAY